MVFMFMIKYENHGKNLIFNEVAAIIYKSEAIMANFQKFAIDDSIYEAYKILIKKKGYSFFADNIKRTDS
jgi:hypothetical protein